MMKAVFYILIVAIALMFAASVGGQIFVPAPVAKSQWFDSSGNPLSGGKLYSYVTGTSTPLNTFTDSTGSTPNANPVILDSAGRANVWLSSGSTYRLRLDTSADVTVWTVDGVRYAGVGSLIGTANQVLVSAATGDVTLSLIGAHSFSTLTQNGVLYGNATGAIQATSQGAANTILWANAGVPSFTTAPTIGRVEFGATSFASLNSMANGTVLYCSNCLNQSNPCTGASTGAIAKILNGSWDCR